ncbi:MAG: SPFH domain-containing protein [bacterium]
MDIFLGLGLGMIGLILLVFAIVAFIVANNLVEICQPNEVLVFSGMGGTKDKGYMVLHGGKKVRIPVFQKVDRIDVTNMVIDINVTNAYSKGGIPLTLKGVANVKIGSDEPYVTNAVERFLGMNRDHVKQIAKETLEGTMRGVLATLTPEEVNNDRLKFAQSLQEEAEHDLTRLGLVLDNLKIQTVADEKGYLDSIGRKQSAELIMTSRIAEAQNRAEATVQDAENQLKKAIAKIAAQKQISKAEAERRVLDAQTRGQAMIAEERSKAGSAIARAKANIDVQRARLEQVKRQLAADIIQPAQAKKAELEAQAKGNTARIVEDGRATADALRSLIHVWHEAGDAARPIFLVQQFDAIMDAMLSTIKDIQIDKITVIDSTVQNADPSRGLPMKAASGSEQIKQTLGLDLPRVLQGLAALQEKG